MIFSNIKLQWHALDRAEQAKYYDMARKEKELHMQLYPGWSARDNYATHTKKKKRKRASEGQSAGNQSVNSDCMLTNIFRIKKKFVIEMFFQTATVKRKNAEPVLVLSNRVSGASHAGRVF